MKKLVFLVMAVLMVNISIFAEEMDNTPCTASFDGQDGKVASTAVGDDGSSQAVRGQ